MKPRSKKMTDSTEWVMESFSDESPFRMSRHLILREDCFRLNMGLYLGHRGFKEW